MAQRPKINSAGLSEALLFNEMKALKRYFYEVSFIIIEAQIPIIITGLFVAVIPQHSLLKAGAVKKSYGV